MVAEGQRDDDVAPPQEGRRMLVMWLCWIVLAALLAAAGVATF
ncbi:MAG: hypothetical protein NXI31_24935 [bacterium]|nr:hypothetical protein [bacterium]